MDYNELSSLQLDALKEVGNIGAGNAATALSQLLNRRIEMTVPRVSIIDFQEMIAETAENEVAGVLVRLLGDAPGNILFVYNSHEAQNIISLLTGELSKDITELGASVLMEVGNIVSSSYMNAIAKLTGLNLIPSVPAMSQDMLGAMLSTMVIEAAQYSDSILEVKTVFMGNNDGQGETEETAPEIGGHFYFVPRSGSLEKILQSLGLN